MIHNIKYFRGVMLTCMLLCLHAGISSAQNATLSQIHIDEYFSYNSLDSIYRVFNHKYGVKVEYDTAFCKTKKISYWFHSTDAEQAIKITLRNTDYTYKITPDNVVHLVKQELTETDKPIKDPEPDWAQEKPKEKALPPIAVITNDYSGPAQTTHFILSGKIKDRSNGEAVPFCLIRVRGTSLGVTTNADGYFTLLNVPSDTSVLLINYIGFRITEFHLTPKLPKEQLSVELEPLSRSLNEVVITGQRESAMNVNNTEVSTLKMTPQKLAQLPNVGDKDIMRAFQLMPGVSSSFESSSGLYVRGGTPDQNLVLYDGITIYHVDHLYGFFSAFNANAIKDVELYKGGFESRFGGRISSVVEMTSKDGNQKNFNIGGEISLLSFNLFTEIPIKKKWTFIAAFRRSFKGPIYDEIFSKFNSTAVSNASNGGSGGGGGFGGRHGGSNATTPASYFYDLNSKLTYRPSDKDVISGSLFTSTDNLDNGFDLNTPSFLAAQGININIQNSDLTRYGNLGAAVKWARKWNTKLYSNTLISYSNYYSDRDKTNAGTITDASGNTKTFSNGTIETNNLIDYSLKSDYQWNPLKGNIVGFGAFVSYYDIAYNYSQNDTSTIIDRRNYGLLGGGYLQDKIKLFNDKLQLTPGIRWSYFNVTNKTYNEPRFSAIYNFNDKWSFKAATGSYYQFVNRVTREDILSGSRDFWILSDGNRIPVSNALHYISGVSYETLGYLFSVEGYYKVLSDLTDYTQRFNVSPTRINYSENFYTGSGTAQGVEFLAQKKFGKLTGWISYTLSKTRDHFSVYSNSDYPSDQDVPNEFKIILLYKWKRWDFSTTWVYATGRPYTAPSGAYGVTLLDGNTADFFTVTSQNSLRLPDYHRMDISANYNLKTPEGRNIGYIGFSIFNVYNRANVWYKTYQIVGSQIVETDVDYLGIVPNITLSLKLR